jgi:hypothetical protein
MEGLSVSKVFGVPEDYTLEQLKKSYVDTMENLFKSNRTQLEKDLLADQYKKLYRRGKQMYLERVSMDTDIEYPSYPYHSSNSSNSSNLNELDLDLDLFDRFDRFDRIFDNSLGFGQRIRKTYNPFSMYDNMFNQLSSSNSNSNSNVYKYSSSYSSNTNPDGSRTIIEQKLESTNGDKKKTINAYKKMPDGSVVNLSEDEMKQLEKMSNLQIKN